MSVTIRIFNERSIGRYYQLAALGAIYDELARNRPGLTDKLLEGLRTGTLTISAGDLDVLAKTLADFLQTYVCAEKDRMKLYPSLYTAGRGDRRILQEIGIQGVRDFTCGSLVEYYSNGSLLRRCNESAGIPMFLRAYVFSSYRDAEEIGETNVASLFVALAGVHISMVGRARKGEGLYEVYLVPDASVDSVVEAHKVYKLIYAIGVKARPWSYVADFARLEGLSYELAVLLSMMLYLYEAMMIAQKLESAHLYGGVFERFKLVNVSPERGRPIVLWERPLTVSHVFALLERRRAMKLLRLLHECSVDALKLGERVERITDIAASCVSDVFGFLESGSLDPLLHCAGSAVRVVDGLEELCRKEPETGACDARDHYHELSGVLALLAR